MSLSLSSREKTELKGYVVVPCFNEEAGLVVLSEKLEEMVKKNDLGFKLQVVFVNDGSSDDTSKVIQKLMSVEFEHLYIVGIELFRNFGYQAAIVTGMKWVLAKEKCFDFLITMDADGEHPVDVIPELISKWRKSRSVVHTKRRQSSSLSILKRLSSRLFYKAFALTQVKVSEGMADFKLWDSQMLRQIEPFLDGCPSTRIFASWIDPWAPIVEYDQRVVDNRKSRFTLKKMIKLAASAFVGFSDLPLRLAAVSGVVAVLFSILLSAYYLQRHLVGDTLPGWTSLAILVLFFGGLQLFFLGIISEYLIRFVFRSKLPVAVYKEIRKGDS